MAVTQAVFNRFLTNVYEQGGNLIEKTIYARDNDPNEACYGYKNGQIMSRESCFMKVGFRMAIFMRYWLLVVLVFLGVVVGR